MLRRRYRLWRRNGFHGLRIHREVATGFRVDADIVDGFAVGVNHHGATGKRRVILTHGLHPLRILCGDIMGFQRVLLKIEQPPRRVARLREGFYQPPQLPVTVNPGRLVMQLDALAGARRL